MSSKPNRRVFLKRAGRVGGLVIAGSSLEGLLAACGGNVSTNTPTTTGTQAIGHAGLLVPSFLQWGATSDGGAPYVFQNPNDPTQLVGFEVEIAQALAPLMGIQEKEVETDYTQLDQALQSEKFDMIMNGWEKTGDRGNTELFSDPYYRYGQQIVVKAGDPRFASMTATDTLSLTNLEGFTVGTGAGFKAADVLATDPKIKLKIYDPDLPFDDLALGRIDAVLIDLPIVTYYVEGIGAGSTQDKRLRAIGQPFATDDYYIAFKKNGANGQPDANGLSLQKEINQALTVLKGNGTLHQIYVKWGLWNAQQAEIGTK